MLDPIPYDPQHAPDAADWFNLDEGERLQQVEAYHRRVRDRRPNDALHAIVHVIVENQVAMASDVPVEQALERLMAEGLDRHDAIHAVGSVLIRHLQGILNGVTKPIQAPNPQYFADLEQLSAEVWRRGS